MNTNLSGVGTCFFQVKPQVFIQILISPCSILPLSHATFPQILASFDYYVKAQLTLLSESL